MKGRDLAQRVAQKLDLSKVAEFNGQRSKAHAAGEGHRGGQVLCDVAVPAAVTSGGACRPIVPPRARVDERTMRTPCRAASASAGARQPARRPELRLGRPELRGPRGECVRRRVSSTQNLDLKVAEAREQRRVADRRSGPAGQARRSRANGRSREYREKQGAGSLDSSQNIVIARLTQLNDAVTRARTDRIQKETLWKQIQAAGRTPSRFHRVIANASIQSLKGQIGQLQQERSRISERYGEKHPEYPEGQCAAGQCRAPARRRNQEGRRQTPRASTTRR